jgi:glucan-binding YG repeat protein
MRDLKKHYKMYKSGKNWCYMAIATLALGVGLFNAGTVHADTNNENSQQDTAQVVSNNQSAVMHSAQEQNSTVIATVANGTHNNSSQIGDYSSNNVADSKVTTQVTQPTVQNGWVKDSNGQMTYYQNGQVSSGRQYVKLPTMPNTNVSGNTNWYLTDNGVAQSGLQEWMGSHYYFDPQTYQVVKNTYVDPNHDNSGYLLGKDGIALNGIQKWQGTYYAFDKTTYRLVKNQKFQEWGYTYQIDDQGRVVSGLYKDNNGDVYYYNPSSYLAETNTYIVPAGTKNGYLFGSDGKALTGVQKWQGTYYYFDPVTKQLVRNNYVKSQWGLYYMFGDDGMIVTGPHMWQGSMYYFDPSSYLVVKNDYRVPAGSDRGYLLGKDGRALTGLQKWQGSFYYFDPETYLLVKNSYVDPDHNNSGYLLGANGQALNGIQKWQGTYYAFDKTTYRLVKNQKFQEWGNTYLIDNLGRVFSGLYKDKNGDIYYYSPITFLPVTNDYVVPTGMYNGYLFGNDGKALGGVQKWQGTYYYFDPNTKQLVRNSYVQSQWGLWYMFGEDGRIVTGPYQWQGSLYYFDPSSYLLEKDKEINGIYFDKNGIGHDTYASKLQNAWASIINGQPGHIGIAIHSQFTGQTYSYTNAPGYRWLTASTVKVAVLSELLHRTGGNLDGTMQSLATRMIRYSDNNATTAICNNYLGGVQGMSSLYRALGMNSTGTTSTWGSTLTTPTDQLKLLDTIYLNNSTSYINNASKDYIQYQMHNVSAGQNWGISAGSSNFYIKNGWIPYGYMYINSIGYIPGNNWSGYTIAVYTDGQPGFQSAINIIERLARATKNIMQ